MVDPPQDDVLSSSLTNYPRWQDHCTKISLTSPHRSILHQACGHTDGEAPERGWANINPVAVQTKQMGRASSRETCADSTILYRTYIGWSQLYKIIPYLHWEVSKTGVIMPMHDNVRYKLNLISVCSHIVRTIWGILLCGVSPKSCNTSSCNTL